MQISSTINHTGRRKITRSEVQVLLKKDEGSTPQFDVRFNLDTSNLPSDAALYVEAYHRNTLQRFDFGTVEKIRPPEKTLLDEIDLSGPVLFRVGVVDQGDHAGRLIASVSGLRPEGDSDEEQRSSLIVVKSTPMEEQVWRMDYQEGSKPTLLINSRIPNAIGQIKSNHLFQALVLPAALRETLIYYLWNEDEEDGSIQQEWVRFGEHLAADKPQTKDPSELLRWIDDVVEEFSKRFKLCNLLVLHMEGEPS